MSLHNGNLCSILAFTFRTSKILMWLIVIKHKIERKKIPKWTRFLKNQTHFIWLFFSASGEGHWCTAAWSAWGVTTAWPVWGCSWWVFALFVPTSKDLACSLLCLPHCFFFSCQSCLCFQPDQNVSNAEFYRADYEEECNYIFFLLLLKWRKLI